MNGIQVFHSINEALRAGFQVYDKTREGYLVRIQQKGQWAFALVVVQE